MQDDHGDLSEYRRKRKPNATREPFGTTGPARSGLFMVHHHHASREHYDLRLEHNGVLLSFAVPKGPSMNSKDKRLAVHVEDHPLDYAEYEGVIPEGQYGAGPTLVWDRGRWVPTDGVDLATGKLSFELYGYKLQGHFALVQKKGDQWLLLKKADGLHHTNPLEPRGVLSGLTVDELRDPTEADARRVALLDSMATTLVDMPDEAPIPMLAETADVPPDDPTYLFELKVDGYRMLATRRSGEVTLTYRSGRNATDTWPEIVRVMTKLPGGDLVLDGEVTVLDSNGRPDFHGVQARGLLGDPVAVTRMETARPATYYVFDAVYADGRDLRNAGLVDRKAFLRALVPPVGPVRYMDDFEDGAALFETVAQLGFEGVMAKRKDSRYQPRRSSDWLKVPASRERCVAVVGWTPRTNDECDLGALVVGVSTGQGFRSVGKCGTGFGAAERERLLMRLLPLSADKPTATDAPPGDIHWVTPELVVRVRFTTWTDKGHLRHPRYVAEVDDVAGIQCVDTSPSHEPPEPEAPEVVGKTTNPDKVFWPAVGLTKGDLVAYYDDIAPFILPWLHDRPVSLVRYPDGVDGNSFFQKNTPKWAPDFVKTVRVKGDDRTLDMLLVNDKQTLHWVANLGAIAIHTGSATFPPGDEADWAILDLDPKDAPFADVVRIAQAVHALCDDIGLPVGCKTSGRSGLHCLIPLGPGNDFETAKLVAALLATLVCAELPDIATMERSIAARGGRVYVDTLQNGRGKQLACTWSARESATATVSTPLLWDEVNDSLDPKRFTLRYAVERARSAGDPLWALMQEAPVLEAALELLARRTSRAPTG